MGRKSRAQLEQEKLVHSLSAYVVFSIFLLLVYTVVEQILSTVTGITHDTLTTCFFAAFGVENVLCAGIKIAKIIKGDVNTEE